MKKPKEPRRPIEPKHPEKEVKTSFGYITDYKLTGISVEDLSETLIGLIKELHPGTNVSSLILEIEERDNGCGYAGDYIDWEDLAIYGDVLNPAYDKEYREYAKKLEEYKFKEEHYNANMLKYQENFKIWEEAVEKRIKELKEELAKLQGE